jgi:hypothetical protein
MGQQLLSGTTTQNHSVLRCIGEGSGVSIPEGSGVEPLGAVTAGGRDPYRPTRLCTEDPTGQVQSACSCTAPDAPRLLQSGAWALGVPSSVRPQKISKVQGHLLLMPSTRRLIWPVYQP